MDLLCAGVLKRVRPGRPESSGHLVRIKPWFWSPHLQDEAAGADATAAELSGMIFSSVDVSGAGLSEAAAAALDIAREAAGLVMQILPEPRAGKDVRHKSPTDLVTRADHEAERLITSRIREMCPGHNILAEEGATQEGGGRAGISGQIAAPGRAHPPGDGPCWIIDPLDGTANFAHGVPWFAISMALEDRGAIRCGVVAVPPLREFFVAERGAADSGWTSRAP